jgi:hypothetical protein
VDKDGGRWEFTTDGGDGGLKTSTSGLCRLLEELDKDVGSRVDVFETANDDSGDGVGSVLSLE